MNTQAHTSAINAQYNPAESRFEALVTFHGPRVSTRVACHIDAPMDAAHQDVVAALLAQAHRRINRPAALVSHIHHNDAQVPAP